MNTLDARFWSKVQKTNSCWNWTANKTKDGYGRFNRLGVMDYAHRISWLIHNGYLPIGFCVCHSCDNPSCINPKHLFLGTIVDNMLDRDKKGRTPKKLTKDQAAEIKKSILPRKELATKFGVTVGAIGHIKRGLFWKSAGD